MLVVLWRLFKSTPEDLEALKRPRPRPQGSAGTGEYAINYFFADSSEQASPWHHIALQTASAGDRGVYTFVCEIPRGTTAKLEITKELPHNPIKQDTKDGKLRHYPSPSLVNYGAMPQTWEDPRYAEESTGLTGDNDPLDVVDFGQKACTPGEVYDVRPIGALAMVDGGEMDWKVVVVREGGEDSAWQDASNPSDSQREKLQRLKEWLRDYKVPDGKPPNEFAFDGKFLGPDVALQVIAEQHRLWKWLVSVERPQDADMWWPKLM